MAEEATDKSYWQKKPFTKTLDHLPRRDDMEIIVRDDGSTDNTLANLTRYRKEHPELNLTVSSNDVNQGVARTKNRLLKDAKGEWVHIHDSDDWVYTELYDEMISEWLARDPKTVYSGIMAYHYNFPREGSLFDLQVKGLI